MVCSALNRFNPPDKVEALLTRALRSPLAQDRTTPAILSR